MCLLDSYLYKGVVSLSTDKRGSSVRFGPCSSLSCRVRLAQVSLYFGGRFFLLSAGVGAWFQCPSDRSSNCHKAPVRKLSQEGKRTLDRNEVAEFGKSKGFIKPQNNEQSLHGLAVSANRKLGTW